jgi:hypothetical protein
VLERQLDTTPRQLLLGHAHRHHGGVGTRAGRRHLDVQLAVRQRVAQEILDLLAPS